MDAIREILTVPSSWRRAQLKSAVDLILGGEDLEDPMLDEGFVAMWADRMPFGDGGGYYVLPVDNWIVCAIGALNDVYSQLGQSFDVNLPEEMQLMREHLVERFGTRLRRYSNGRKLVTKVFDDYSQVGFRWEPW